MAGCSASGLSRAQPSPKPGAAATALTSKNRVDAVREASKRKRPSAPVSPWPIRSRWSFFNRVGTQGRRGRPTTLTGTPAIGLPDGSRTRPTTVIRPGAASSGFAATGVGGGPAGILLGSSFIAGEWLRNPAPVASAPRNRTVRATSFSLWISMDFSTSRARAAVEAESASPAAGPAAKRIAARVVVSHRRDETEAEAGRASSTAASAAPGSMTPRRVSARRSFSRARATRLRTVPCEHRSRLAASWMVRPSR